MSPSQRRDVREQFRRNIETILAAQVDSLTKVERVPVDDNGREQIEPCDPIMLAFAGPIPDLALTADAQRILEGVMRFAFVEADLRPSLHVSIKDPVDQEQRTLDPAYLAQRQSQVVLPGIGRQFAKQLAGGDPAAVDRGDTAEQIGPVGDDDVLAYFTGDEFSQLGWRPPRIENVEAPGG